MVSLLEHAPTLLDSKPKDSMSQANAKNIIPLNTVQARLLTSLNNENDRLRKELDILREEAVHYTSPTRS
jgi:hypothetical protein